MAISPSLYFFLLSFITSISLLIIIRLKLFPFHSKINKCLPPSPQKLPILGNILQLGSFPHESLNGMSKKHGPLMLLHLGSRPTLIASSTAAAQDIMKTHDLSFCSRPSLTMANILFYDSKNVGFSPYGEHWRQLKSIVVINLLSNAHVKSFRQVREEETSLLIGMLGESCGSLVDLGALLVSLTNNIICRVAFGRVYPGSKFTDLLTRHLELIAVFSVGGYIPWLSWVDRLSGLEGRAKRIAREFDEFLEGVIKEHVNKKGGDAKGDEEQDIVDVLLDVQKDNTTGFTLERDTLKAVILDVFAGGTDTIFTTLEWIMSELIKHPPVMKKLQQEVTRIAQGRSMITEEDLEKMQYLKAVIKESYRLHPPAPLLIPRESTEDVKLMGYDIPAGTQVMVNVWAIGRDPAIWKEAGEFRPERFLNSSVDFKGIHFELIPFGAGRRRCPGIQFSVAVIELVLANVVYKFDFGLPNGVINEDLDMTEKYGVTESSLLVMASPRF